MCRSDAQLAQVCETLCRSVGLNGMWTWNGSTGKATDVNLRCFRRTPGWSHGEILLWQTAWAFWNGNKKPSLYDMTAALDSRHLALIGTLLVAIAEGPTGIDGWLERYAPASAEARS
jgi:hypothetical protein